VHANAAVDKGAICRIVCDGVDFDYLRPFNKTGSSGARTGTGFFLDGVRDEEGPLLVTAYHCVGLAVRIRVLVEGVSQNFLPAKLVGANPKLDVALLRVPLPPSSLPSLPSLPVGDSDACFTTQRLQAVGFALGKPWMQTTVGVVSGRTNVHLQIDAAINGGNSGGPVVDDDGKVIGIVLAGIDGAQNVNYMCPITEARMAIRRIVGGEKCVSNAQLSCNLVLGSPLLVESLGCRPGVRCASVVEGSPLHAAGMREGDVLNAVGGYAIDIQGRIEPGTWWPDRLPLFALLERLDPSDEVEVSFWSAARGEEVKAAVRLAEGERPMRFRTLYCEFDRVDYTAFGGLVVQPLSKNLLAHFKVLAVLMQRPQLHLDSVLVVTDVLPESPFAEMHNVGKGDIVLAVDGEAVRTIEAYRAAVGRRAGVRRILLRSGVEVYASAEQIEACHDEIRARISGDVVFS